jgi:hypothetical protein
MERPEKPKGKQEEEFKRGASANPAASAIGLRDDLLPRNPATVERKNTETNARNSTLLALAAFFRFGLWLRFLGLCFFLGFGF